MCLLGPSRSLSFVIVIVFVIDVGLSSRKSTNDDTLRALKADCFPSVPVFPTTLMVPIDEDAANKLSTRLAEVVRIRQRRDCHLLPE